MDISDPLSISDSGPKHLFSIYNDTINNKVLVEHDANIGDNCHISTGAIINGNVNVGFQSFVGSGVVTKQSISIGNNCIVGAGTVLKKDLVSNTLIK